MALVYCVVVEQEILCVDFFFSFFFFNDTATTEIYTLSLHDALPISEMNFTSINLKVPYFSKINVQLKSIESPGLIVYSVDIYLMET